MKTFTATFSNGSGPYNIYNVITGQQIGGVTPSTGQALWPTGTSIITGYLRIRNEKTNVGNIRIGDSSVNISNFIGYPIDAGGEFQRDAQGNTNAESLNFWMAVTDNAQRVTIMWE